jgi:hypothetical protein
MLWQFEPDPKYLTKNVSVAPPVSSTYLSIDSASKGRHARESGHPEKYEGTGFPFARE